MLLSVSFFERGRCGGNAGTYTSYDALSGEMNHVGLQHYREVSERRVIGLGQRNYVRNVT